MLVADHQNITRFNDLLDGIQLIHDLTFGTQSDHDEVHVEGFCGHGDLINAFRENQIVVKRDGTAPVLSPDDISFFNI